MPVQGKIFRGKYSLQDIFIDFYFGKISLNGPLFLVSVQRCVGFTCSLEQEHKQ